jgi:hypothetical protein
LHAYWTEGNPTHVTLRALVDYLSTCATLTVYYLGPDPLPRPTPYSLHHFPLGPSLFPLSQHLHETNYDTVIVEPFQCHFISDFFPKQSRRILYTHDLWAQRSLEFAQHGLPLPCPVSAVFEQSVFSKFDRVVFIQQEEADYAARWIGKERCAASYLPIAARAPVPIRDEVHAIRFLGGLSPPNFLGLQWFHDEVLPLLGELGARCCVSGTITQVAEIRMRCPRLDFQTTAPCLSTLYAHTDISINPLTAGSGLKMKSMEALAHGVPLVTTSVGAQGLKEEAGASYLLADDAEAFAKALLSLARSKQLREQLSARAFTFFKERFTPEKCFRPFLH